MVDMRCKICENNRLLMIYYIRYKHKYHHLIHLVTTNQNRYFLKILYCNNIYEPLRCPSNQGIQMLHHHQTMIQNQLMSQKELLEDLETLMEYRQKHEHIPLICNLNQQNLLDHSYQAEDGEHLIFNILLKKGQL